MKQSAEASMGVSDRTGRVATERGLLITQRSEPAEAPVTAQVLVAGQAAAGPTGQWATVSTSRQERDRQPVCD
jgi:hypothetical protein